MSPLVLSFFKIVVMLVLICLMYLNAIEYKTIDSENIPVGSLLQREKEHTQLTVCFLGLERFGAVFWWRQRRVRFPAVAGAAVSQLQALVSLVSVTDCLHLKVTSPTHFPSGFFIFTLCFSTLSADLHGQGRNPSRLSEQPCYAALPEVWIQD